MKITVQSKNTGLVKELKVGFSWTFLFFGSFVYIFRGNWSEFWKCFFLSGITLGIYALIQCWTANKKEIVRYMEKGYTAADPVSEDKLVRIGLIGRVINGGVSV
ncbi:hypothetical protein [Paenibacillus sp. Soil724D2]|uniref:hypothetical protein n=1 Tax=Paenibacillus sp. (strain Soil724D2) TaxID=1736392 RepID=UPI0007123B76|nr:hypothetical protein [Paenibacillus sp. Soil724D2]KRE33415.1 hypothetical protein ASG85_14190 [Paenibacillus sp. Soil724D2]